MEPDIHSGAELSEIPNTVALSMINESKRLMNTVVDFKELLMRYTCAMKEIRTKVEVLNTEYNVRYQRNPIVSITTRLKQTVSIVEKLDRLGLSFSVENVEMYLNDVAGVRVVCSYVDDVYTIARALIGQDDITLIREKDYIKNPKENGYRSLHLIVGIPVFFSDVRRVMKAEIQIRTVAMDYWAGLEHQLKYKQDDVPYEEQIVRELKICADQLADIDKKMYGLRGKIELMKEKPDEDEILFEKLKNIDFPMN